METVTAIMVYQFAQLTREEIEVMLNLRLEDTRVYREAKEEGRLEGREEGREEGRRLEAVQLVMRQLQRRLGQELSEEMRSEIDQLSLSVLEGLSEALLDFSSLADLEVWLRGDRLI